MTAGIQLSQGKLALVDDEDFDLLSDWTWYASLGKGTYYALANTRRADGRKTIVQMHRVILAAPAGVPVDHRNGNGLDNRRCNLRLCDWTLNNANMRPRGGCSAFKGVWFRRDTGRWTASIKCRGRRINLGCFDTDVDAARAYDAAALATFGEFARLNFPELR